MVEIKLRDYLSFLGYHLGVDLDTACTTPPSRGKSQRARKLLKQIDELYILYEEVSFHCPEITTIQKALDELFPRGEFYFKAKVEYRYAGFVAE